MYKQILVAIDGSKLGDKAVKAAIGLANGQHFVISLLQSDKLGDFLLRRQRPDIRA